MTGFSSFAGVDDDQKRLTALQSWYAALGGRAQSPANLVLLGDSMTQGQGATAFDRTWAARLRVGLRGRYPTTGVTGGRGFISPLGGLTGVSSAIWPTSQAGAAPIWTDSAGPKKRVWRLNSATSYTWTLQGTAVDLHYWSTGSTGHVSYSVDGGGAVDLNTATGATGPGTKLRIPLGASGAHTLTIAWVSGQNYVEGVTEFDGDELAGIRVHEAGHSGISAWQWDQVPHSTEWATSVAALSPHAIVIGLGINDFAQLVTPADFRRALVSMIADLRAVCTNSPGFVLMGYDEPNAAGLQPFGAYYGARASIAGADAGVCSFDLSTRIPKVAGDVLGLYSDTTHFTDKGHGAAADHLLRWLA